MNQIRHALPAIGSTWLSTKGKVYTVLMISNVRATRSDFPVTVVYQDTDGEIWSRPFGEWYERMTEITE